MDFEKIKAAAEDIKLTDAEKEKMILLCEASKKNKKKSRFVPVAAAAAAAVFAFVIFSPGFLLKASEADKNFAPQENAAANDYEFFADSADGAAGVILHSSTADNSDHKNDIGGASISTRKYRVNYYDVPYQFVLLVGEDAFWEWDEKYNNEDPDKTNVMVMKKFIEYFNITREQFDKANLEWTKTILYDMGGKPVMNPKDFANQETDESYNADVIFTFNDEIINEYYLSHNYPFLYEHEYEEAVANGTYETRTTEFIDIEDMEAEIIAKYGEAEIVTQKP